MSEPSVLTQNISLVNIDHSFIIICLYCLPSGSGVERLSFNWKVGGLIPIHTVIVSLCKTLTLLLAMCESVALVYCV